MEISCHMDVTSHGHHMEINPSNIKHSNNIQQHPTSSNSIQQHPTSSNSIQRHPTMTSHGHHMDINPCAFRLCPRIGSGSNSCCCWLLLGVVGPLCIQISDWWLFCWWLGFGCTGRKHRLMTTGLHHCWTINIHLLAAQMRKKGSANSFSCIVMPLCNVNAIWMLVKGIYL